MKRSPESSALILLHVIVFIFGFTGILGKLISTDADVLVWWRMLIAAVAIGVFSYATGNIVKPLSTHALRYALVGLIIAAHWILFFHAIKISTVSVTLACLSASSLYTALLEPLFFRRRIDPFELVFGVMVVAGLFLIFSFETEYTMGIVVALLSAFFSSLFTVLNGVFIKQDNPYRISLVEMIAGVVGISVWLMFTGKFGANLWQSVPSEDWLWIVILGVVATAFAFVGNIKVMEHVTPYTVSLSINLEPVYGIVLAYFIFGDEERMSVGFYVGACIIVLALYLNTMLKRGKIRFTRMWR